MASTNKTTTLDLSQFVGTDKPDWLTDYNDDMEKIDTWATTADFDLSLIHISEPTRFLSFSYAVFCMKQTIYYVYL